ncbi:hemicentin-1-like [Saccostrea echinata]|uniref:hemicentin-1-like n=1 Tax=Saccostrea echinata TaxID=191078 RepID=UPI002A7FE318|nr:hemicentin-1-like [Saccostrea echinata]
MMLEFLKFLSCQNIVTSEIGSDTCISFWKPSMTYGDKVIIMRDKAQLCVKYSNQNILLDSNYWNRNPMFSCNESSVQLAVCFTNTQISDAGAFYMANESSSFPIENYTLNVEYPPNVSTMNEQKVIEGQYVFVTCNYTVGNPPSTTVYWTKDESYFRQNQKTLSITNVSRSDSGTYVCFAENTYSSGRKGISNNTLQLDVQYPPTISLLTTQKPVEGDDLTVVCNVTEGNPSSVTQIRWTRSGYGFLQNGKILSLTSIQRSQSGSYTCTAENTYFSGTRGRDTQSMTIDVEYPPKVSAFSSQYPVEYNNLIVSCVANNGNPSSTLYYWTKSEDDDFQQNNTKLSLYSIDRNQSGTYICTAENTYTSGSKGSDSKQLVVDVQYPPLVSTIADIRPVEQDNVRVQCNVIKGNPSSTNVFWTKSGSSSPIQSGYTLELNYIRRGNSGTYYCVAENSYIGGGKGRTTQSFLVDVLYGPTLNGQTLTISEGQRAQMSTTVTSNPASSVSWFRGNDKLYTQGSVSGISTYTISRARCTDTGQFRVVASNGIQNNYSTVVNLYVYCSPRLNSSGSSVFVPIGNNKYLDGDVTILSYPQPNYTLTLPNGAPNTLIDLSISTISTNIFRITLRRSNIQPEDHGIYKMIVSNAYGTTIINIYVNPKSKPLKSDQVLVSCGNRKAHVTWQSSYFGYEDQNSFVQYSTKPDSVVFSNGSGIIPERIKQELLHVTVSSLQDNTMYFFRVVTSNRYGFSLSKVVNCTTDTLNEDTSSAPIAIGAVLGTLLALSIAAVAFISYNYFQGTTQKLKH